MGSSQVQVTLPRTCGGGILLTSWTDVQFLSTFPDARAAYYGHNPLTSPKTPSQVDKEEWVPRSLPAQWQRVPGAFLQVLYDCNTLAFNAKSSRTVLLALPCEHLVAPGPSDKRLKRTVCFL
jgi:hypothetical protein